MKDFLRLFLMMMATLVSLSSSAFEGDSVLLHRQRAFPSTVPAGNYSGIAWLGGDRYAVVDDKSVTAGFWLMTVQIDSLTGALLSVTADSFMTSQHPNRDEEGICYHPDRGTVFASGEADGEILEYRLDGRLTGCRLSVPEVFRTARPNSGFEALTYDSCRHRFWTTSEQTLRADGDAPSKGYPVPNRLRLQSFTDDLMPAEQYWYETDAPVAATAKGRSLLGVSGLSALSDGRLVVLEREVYQHPRKIGSFVQVKLYAVRPDSSVAGQTLGKQLLTSFRTCINLTARSFANYEGLCAGPLLRDGRQVLLMLCDSQNQYKGWLKDWFRTVVVKVAQ